MIEALDTYSSERQIENAFRSWNIYNHDNHWLLLIRVTIMVIYLSCVVFIIYLASFGL